MYAFCTRDELAGGISFNSNASAYKHLLVGDCLCGRTHGYALKVEAELAYDYLGIKGELLFQVVRKSAKKFSQRRPDGQGGWLYNLEGVPRVPYRLPELHTSDPADWVFIVEGEKDVDKAIANGLVATCNPQGAGKWEQGFGNYLVGRKVAIVPDNDVAGTNHGKDVASKLLGHAGKVVLLDPLEGVPDKGDLSDWLALGHTGDELKELANNAGAVTKVEAPAHGLQVVALSDVKRKEVHWIWHGRIARGKLNLVVGDPDVGKSFLTLDIAARVTVGGRFPDEASAPKGDVLLFSAEDDPEDTIAPRFDKMRGDDSRLHVVRMTVKDIQGNEELISLSKHLRLIEEAIIRYQPALIIIDPVSAFVGTSDSHKSSDIRRLLAPLADIAARYNVAILGVMHLNKRSGEGKAQYRVSGTLDFVAVARSVLLAGIDPEDEDSRILVPVKNNLAERSPALRYHLDADGITWDGIAENTTAQDLLATPEKESKTQIDECIEFLEEVLASGGLPVDYVLREARQAGLSEKTLRRAGTQIGIEPRRFSQGNTGKGLWLWYLLGTAPAQGGQAYPPNGGHLANPIGETEFSVPEPQGGQLPMPEVGHVAEEVAEWT
jgi:putative DNA primase/helicase